MAQDDAEYLSASEFAADYFTLPRLADVTTPEEMLAILAGGTVYLRIVGTSHPPVMVWAEPPPPEDNPYLENPPHG